ncbi:MAG: NAD-dependent epimerase/dehydratase family protein [Halobacteriota archaeon]
MKILLTGANGTVGNAIFSELGDRDDYEFVGIDVEPHPDRDTIVADVTDYDDIRPHFDGVDAVVHLAASVDLSASWEEILQTNVIGTANVLEAAADAEVESFVFASSIHTVGLYESELAPELYDPEYDLELDHTTPVRPDSFYGVSKVFGEAMGRLYVESTPNSLARVHPAFETNTREYPTRFYSLRIKSVRDADFDHPYGLAEEGVEAGMWERGSEEYEYMADRLKATWLSHRDLAHLVDRCLQDETVTFDVFWGVSDNDGRWVDLDHGRTVIGYDPQDNGAEWEGPPAGE